VRGRSVGRSSIYTAYTGVINTPLHNVSAMVKGREGSAVGTNRLKWNVLWSKTVEFQPNVIYGFGEFSEQDQPWTAR